MFPSVYSGIFFTSIIKQPPNINRAFPLLLFKLGAGFHQLLVELPNVHRLDCVNAALCNKREGSISIVFREKKQNNFPINLFRNIEEGSWICVFYDSLVNSVLYYLKRGDKGWIPQYFRLLSLAQNIWYWFYDTSFHYKAEDYFQVLSNLSQSRIII